MIDAYPTLSFHNKVIVSTNSNMTIRNNNTTASTNEPNLIPAVPVYYDYDEFNSHHQYYSAASGAPSGPVEPVSSAVALTTGQSYRYRREDQLQLQLITIPSSNVLADYSVPPQTTIQKDKLTTVRPVQVTAVIEPLNNCNSNNNSSNSSNSNSSTDNSNSNGKYIRRHGMIINRKHAHLPEPILRFQQQRQQRTKIAAWTGGVVGLVVAGPLGAALGAGTAYATAKTVGKQREHRMTREWRHHNDNNNNHNLAWPVEQVIV